MIVALLHVKMMNVYIFVLIVIICVWHENPLKNAFVSKNVREFHQCHISLLIKNDNRHCHESMLTQWDPSQHFAASPLSFVLSMSFDRWKDAELCWFGEFEVKKKLFGCTKMRLEGLINKKIYLFQPIRPSPWCAWLKQNKRIRFKPKACQV